MNLSYECSEGLHDRCIGLVFPGADLVTDCTCSCHLGGVREPLRDTPRKPKGHAMEIEEENEEVFASAAAA